jgi:hypothetical protein
MRILVTRPSRLVQSGAGTPAAHASIGIRHSGDDRGSALSRVKQVLRVVL